MSATKIELAPGELVLSNTASEEQWLAARRTGIGASEISAVAGLSQRRGPWDVWAAKVDGTELESTDEMRWGTWIESRIVDWWARETGRTVGNGGLFRHPVHRWLLATPDALVLEPVPEGKNQALLRVVLGEPLRPVATVDAKNSGWHMSAEWDDDGAPVDYLAQLTQQMLAVGVRQGYLVASIGGKPPVERAIGLDEEFAQQLIQVGDRFWQDVQDGVPPAVDGSRSARKYLAAKYPDADPDYWAGLDDTDVAALRDRVHLEAHIKRLETMADAIENQIKAKLGKASAGTYNGKTYCTWKKIDRAGYTVKPTSYRTFKVPKAIEKELADGDRG